MKKVLLPRVPFYKAALHTHTTLSDGKLTPQEAKQLYRQRGYQILCMTDHNIHVSHNELTEPDFLMLTGFEWNTAGTPGWSVFSGKTYHLLFIAKKPDNLWQPLPRHGVTADHPGWAEQAENMDRTYSIDSVNAVIARGNEKGFLCCYNHPVWSLQNYMDWAPLEGLWAMELCNSGADLTYDRDNSVIYHDMCRQGKRIVPLGTDDSHSAKDAGLAYTMVGAQALTYEKVIEALEKGDLYISTGPRIHSLCLEDGILQITCSEAARILVETGNRFRRQAVGSPTLTEASLDMTQWLEKSQNEPDTFLRVTVTAPDGSYAATRAYWRNELV